MSDMNVTIYDIARKCHVSIATVSRVLNGNSRVSEKTRRLVLDTMKDMGYTPNPFARGLGLDSMKIVGVLCTSLTDAFLPVPYLSSKTVCASTILTLCSLAPVPIQDTTVRISPVSSIST